MGDLSMIESDASDVSLLSDYSDVDSNQSDAFRAALLSPPIPADDEVFTPTEMISKVVDLCVFFGLQEV